MNCRSPFDKPVLSEVEGLRANGEFGPTKQILARGHRTPDRPILPLSPGLAALIPGYGAI